MSSAPVLTHVANRIGRVVLNRPEAINAVTIELAERLAAAVRELPAQADVIVLSGAGGNFSVGGDYRELLALRREGPAATRRLFDAFGDACRAIVEAPVPVVAAVEGYALAGGFELLQVCDVTIVRDDARLADNHVNFGMLPGGGGSQRLPRIVGRQRALGHILTGEQISGSEAAAWGLVYRAVDAAGFEQEVASVTRRLAGHDRETLARCKRLMLDGLSPSLQAGLGRETDAIVAHLQRDGAMDRFTERGERRR
jgi:enoyl-CoA hydratase/carnithine racemase